MRLRSGSQWLTFEVSPAGDWDVSDISGVNEAKAEKLKQAGFRTKSDFKNASQAQLSNVKTVSNALAARIKADFVD